MKIKYLKFKNWILLSLMSAFGLSACHNNKTIVAPESNDIDSSEEYTRQMIEMYGVPSREWVEDKADSIPTMPQAEPKQTQPREPQVTVYGVPTVDYAVKGRVVDSNGKPIKGLVVSLINSNIDIDNLPDTPHWQEQMRRVSDTTDAEGAFSVRTSDRPWDTVRVLVRDVDGSKNGNFEQQVLNVEFEDGERGDGSVSSWRLGEKKADVTIKMKKKK